MCCMYVHTQSYQLNCTRVVCSTRIQPHDLLIQSPRVCHFSKKKPPILANMSKAASCLQFPAEMDWMPASRPDSFQEWAIMLYFTKLRSPPHFLIYVILSIYSTNISLLLPPCIKGANTCIKDPARFQDWYIPDRKRSLHVYNFILFS